MSGNSKHKIAFNYFGGKFTFLDDLYDLFPSAKEFDHLVDLFAGSFCVSINYKHNGPLIKTANEINGEVTNFFSVLRDHESKLLNLLRLTPVSLIEYEKSWEKCNDDVERARRFYVRIRQSFFGLGAQRKNKGWHMAKKHANSNGGETVSRWNNGVEKLHEVAEVIRKNFQITPWDFEECCLKIDHGRAFFYCDPPYTKRSRASYNDYTYEFTDEDHRRLSKVLHELKGLVMISGYDCSLMNELYKDWAKFRLKKRKNNIRSGEVQEIVWVNYTPRSTMQKNLFNTKTIDNYEREKNS